MESIAAALVSGAVTLVGVLIANGRSQAVTDTKLEELTREVRAHNHFAQRIPVLEESSRWPATASATWSAGQNNRKQKGERHEHFDRDHRPHRLPRAGPH